MVTAVVNVSDHRNQLIPCRSLRDTCSTTNFMTEELAGTLGLKKRTYHIPIGAVNTLTTFSKGIVSATIRSPINGYERSLTFLVVPSIAHIIPDQPIDPSRIKIPSNLKLADPQFHIPAPVDLLLGAGTTLSLLCIGQLNLSPSEGLDLYLQKTGLGWVIGGSAPSTRPSYKGTRHTTSVGPEFDMTKFWEIEEGPSIHFLTDQEKKCEEHFEQYTTRTIQEGCYCVALPFNDKIHNLGESKSMALKRLRSIEKKLDGDPDLKQNYHNVLQEYLTLGHMSPVNDIQPNEQGYYLPHHAVIKQSSLTTKVRVVFDGSAKTTTKISSNDTLLVGPTIQPDIFVLLIRFRKHAYVLTGDIEKMYRQILVRPADRRYQRILWRTSSGKIQSYELNTVPFGLSSAPYLAIRSLHQLAEDEKHRFPKAVKVLKEDFYVDDLLTGASTKGEVVTLRKEMTELSKCAGFTMGQWATNDPEIQEQIAKESVNLHLNLGESGTLKTLGVHCNSGMDSIVYAVKPMPERYRVTKRFILSETAKIFDPLGLLAPVTITAKILMQRLWSLKLDWDETLPATIVTDAQEIQLHGFSDASAKAYGACIYLRTIGKDGQIQTELLCAKSRVAPLKTVTIPRLELCGAVLLTSLAARVKDEIQLKIDRTFLWTDSTIVLHWIRTPPHQLKTFVANRISEIQTKSNVDDWGHVHTHDNPADLASRGQAPEEFLQLSNWHNGPPWLTISQDEETWPPSTFPQLDELPEHRSATCLATTKPVDCAILTRYSSISKLQRVIAYCMWFARKSKSKGSLTVLELRTALQIMEKDNAKERLL